MQIGALYSPEFDPETPLKIADGYTGQIQACEWKQSDKTGTIYIGGSIAVTGGPEQDNGASPEGKLVFFSVFTPKDPSEYKNAAGYRFAAQRFREFLDAIGQPDELPDEGELTFAVGASVSFNYVQEPNKDNPDNPYKKVQFVS